MTDVYMLHFTIHYPDTRQERFKSLKTGLNDIFSMTIEHEQCYN